LAARGLSNFIDQNMRTAYFLTACILALMLNCLNASAQNRKERREIKKIANSACACSEKISATITKDEILEQMNSCITSAIINAQIGDIADLKNIRKLLQNAKINIINGDTTLVVGSDSKKIILADKNFREVQQYLMQKCKTVQNLIRSEDMLSDKSLSSNPVAFKHYKEGESYAEKDKTEKAIESFKKAVELDPEFAFAWDNLGLCYRKLNKYDDAIRCYKKSLEVDEYGIMPLQNMAVVYEYRREYKEAAEVYLKLMEGYPDNPEGYYGAGRAYYMSGDYASGVDYMFKAYKLYSTMKSPYVTDAENNLSAFYKDLKDKGKESIILDAAKKNNIEFK
jgi:tetratricopeptide (TPR) repeat protein